MKEKNPVADNRRSRYQESDISAIQNKKERLGILIFLSGADHG
jgi:hypothetical protein